ncbi:metallophosphoesterase [Helicobacter cappadocius]|uniref:Metallophosphoesterase n=1 Tax=Helicobacter cappadocius TaxID=3063998 RepID=A0AA90PJS7_9HELI|nr:MULTISPECIES: metallophosphoesterase [unclassified Helicobacter]MDO7253639.1 metallophosphoesterase [Helicobacter sp. faydin-H75]MDP2539567.1 metallophosphoesterase [Helicobacter sp. faydin-H76]
MENTSVSHIHLYFGLISLGVSLISHLIIYWGLFYKLNKSKIPQNILKFLIFLNAIAVVCYIYFQEYPLPIWLYTLLSLSIGIGFIFLVFTLLYQLIILPLRFFSLKKLRKKIQNIMVIACVLYTSYGIYIGQTSPIMDSVSISLKNLSTPLKVVQLSDVHISTLMTREKVKKIVDKVNAQNPDIIVLTGDIIDTQSRFAELAIEELKNLKATYGVYYVLGNHEYYHDINNIIKKLKDIGLNVLINQNILVQVDKKPILNIAGIADLMGDKVGFLKPNIDKTLQGINTNIPTLLLSHQPKIISQTQDKPIDLILSGHTHGGQIFPFSLAVLLDQPFIKGLHHITKNQTLYINQGTNLWGPPMRIGTHYEITIINLIPKK